jgi:geranylgeranyl pyrophosphate synthase
MLDYKMDTLRSIRTPNSIRGYELIQDNLNLVEELLLAELPGQHSLMTDAASQLFQAGGKRFRAAICLLAAGVFGADPEASLPLAAGIEMLHNATLVHDDLIDESLLRRGKPTLNSGQNAKFSVLIGDYFFARAANLVAETNNLDIMRQFTETLTTILNGEITQQFSRWRFDRQEYFDRIYAKTGAMFVLAAKSAATLGEADEQEVLRLEKYGYYTGIAFQIIDDILDFTGKTHQLGKPIGNDLRQGLFTLPVLLYIDQHPNDPDFKQLLEVQEGESPAATNLANTIRDSDAIDQALSEARDLVSQGQRALRDVPHSPYTDALASIADTIVNRKV